MIIKRILVAVVLVQDFLLSTEIPKNIGGQNGQFEVLQSTPGTFWTQVEWRT